MKARLLLACLAAAFVLNSSLRLRAADAPAPAGSAAAPAAPAAPAAAGGAAPAAAASAQAKGGDDDDTELAKKMQKVGKAFKKLRKEVADPTKASDALAQVDVIADGLTAAADLSPAKADDLPADKRDAFIAQYKQGLKDMQAKIADLKAALAAGKTADAVALVDQVLKLEHKDHKAFRRPENH